MDERAFKELLNTIDDADRILNTPQKPSIRVNTLKISVKEFLSITHLPLQPTFYPYAFYLDEKEMGELKIGTTWEHYLGYIHSQVLSSIVVSAILDPKPHDLVLDIAASPGSKTTHMAMLMENKGAILANDVSWERNSVLFSNIVRLGVINTKIIARDGCRLHLPPKFDKVLADVPCSALSSPYAYKRLTDRALHNLTTIQKKIILRAFEALKPGGEMVYSTCTYHPAENEEVVQFLLNKKPNAHLVNVDVNFPHSHGLTDYGSEMKKTLRIYPYHFYSEGFFIAKIKKVM
jgi:NOL1/NOP2/sun family putative RNA methylase